MLAEICSRGQAAEIHYWHRNEPRVARTQLIELGEEQIKISKPQCIGADVVIRVGTPITIYFPYAKDIFAFKSTILEPTTIFSLNRNKKIVGVAIERPTEIVRQQRRHDYRVSLAVYDIRAWMHRLVEGDVRQAPINADRFEGRLTNISTSGFGIILPSNKCPRMKLWDHFMSRFSLPEQGDFMLPVQLRHARRVHEGENIVMGFRFCDVDDPHVRRQSTRLSRFITSEQRRQLQFKRKA